MPSPEAQTVIDIVNSINQTYPGAMIGLLLLNAPGAEQYLMDVGHDAGSSMTNGRVDGSQYGSMPFWPAYHGAVGNPNFNLQFMGVFQMAALSWVGDAVVQGNLSDSNDPTLQFLRHLRNAVSHGNKWHFNKGEPKTPAAFAGVTLDPAVHQDQPALYETISTGDVFALLDDVATIVATK